MPLWIEAKYSIFRWGLSSSHIWVCTRCCGHGSDASQLRLRHELRAELLGYDVRQYRLLVFVIGAGIAGVAGVLSINYTGFISPSTFNLAAAAQPIMWVLVGGLGTLVGPIVGCVTLLLITFVLGATQIMNTYFVYGLVVMVFALAIPQGIVPTVREWRDPIVRLGKR